MYGVQPDHLAAALGVSEARARRVTAGWRTRRYAESARLGPGGPWTWLTKAGLAACGLRYTAAPPALGRLAHIRAVTAVRLALESARQWSFTPPQVDGQAVASRWMLRYQFGRVGTQVFPSEVRR